MAQSLALVRQSFQVKNFLSATTNNLICETKSVKIYVICGTKKTKTPVTELVEVPGFYFY
jgi:hypothetical protein